MPTPTMIPLATYEFPAAASTVTFSNIPAVDEDDNPFTDLVIYASVFTGTDPNLMQVYFNGSYISNSYDTTWINTREGNQNSGQADFYNEIIGNLIANTQAFSYMRICGYTSGSFGQKTIMNINATANTSGASRQSTSGVLWEGSEAINSVRFTHLSRDFPAGTTFSLFGVH